MIRLERINTSDKRYSFVESLLQTSFPEVERRDNADQREVTDNNTLFTPYIITDNDRPDVNIGLITIWSFGDFCYVEHLATSPEVRNHGYGARIMEALKEKVNCTIVLEVEKPEDEMSIRRIKFYERCGFKLCYKDYIQPAYRKGGETIPLYIMFYGAESIDEDFDKIKTSIYRNVYNVPGI